MKQEDFRGSCHCCVCGKIIKLTWEEFEAEDLPCCAICGGTHDALIQNE